jgi:uncharacterized membrane protein (UPF0127 family)
MNRFFRIACIWLLMATGLISGTSCSLADSRAMYLPTDAAPLVVIGKDGVKRQFTVEIADTPDERARGLMFRPALAPDHGMLFVFPYTREVSFWMENTPQPLDLVFIKDDGRVAAVMKGEPFSRAIIDPQVPVRYVLELGSGVAKLAGIDDGALMAHPVIHSVAAAGMN